VIPSEFETTPFWLNESTIVDPHGRNPCRKSGTAVSLCRRSGTAVRICLSCQKRSQSFKFRKMALVPESGIWNRTEWHPMSQSTRFRWHFQNPLPLLRMGFHNVWRLEGFAPPCSPTLRMKPKQCAALKQCSTM
jgi:hypothetical protein